MRAQAAQDVSEVPGLKRLLQDRRFKMGGIDGGRAIAGHEGKGNRARPQHLGHGIDRDAPQIHVEKREIELAGAGSVNRIIQLSRGGDHLAAKLVEQVLHQDRDNRLVLDQKDAASMFCCLRQRGRSAIASPVTGRPSRRVMAMGHSS